MEKDEFRLTQMKPFEERIEEIEKEQGKDFSTIIEEVIKSLENMDTETYKFILPTAKEKYETDK